MPAAGDEGARPADGDADGEQLGFGQEQAGAPESGTGCGELKQGAAKQSNRAMVRAPDILAPRGHSCTHKRPCTAQKVCVAENGAKQVHAGPHSCR